MYSSDATPESSELGATPLPSAEIALAMLEALSTPLCLRDHKSRYVWANAAFQSAFGRGRAELLGKTDFDLLPPEQALLEQMRDARVFQEGQHLFFEDLAVWDRTVFPRDTAHRSVKEEEGLLSNTGGKLGAEAAVAWRFMNDKKFARFLNRGKDRSKI